MNKSSGASGTVQENVNKIARLETELLERRSPTERLGEAIGHFAGSMSFIVLHALWFAVWIILNANIVPGFPAFDPYPYMFLSMAVSLEAVILSTFVLMKQNLMSRRADHRAHLDLQVNLLAEQEVTKILQLLQTMCTHLGLHEEARDAQVEELTQNTAIEELAQELKNSLPDT